MSEILNNEIAKHNCIKSIINSLPDGIASQAVLCAVSGGPDSMTLLHALSALSGALGFSVYAAHYNHGLRDAAAGDADFVRAWCKDYKILLFEQSGDVAALARQTGLSLEAAGREARYAFLRSCAEKLGAKYIALGHHARDQAETLLLNLTRGAGLSGLCAMSAVSGDLIRPMLGLSKSEILNYLEENSIEYRIDESNSDLKYSRNRVRAVIAELERINPRFVENACRTAELLKLDKEALEYCALSDFNDPNLSAPVRGAIETQELLRKPQGIQAAIIRALASRAGLVRDLEATHVRSIIALCNAGRTGKSIDLPHGYEAAMEYGLLKISKKRDNSASSSCTYELALVLPGETSTPMGTIVCEIAECPPVLGVRAPFEAELKIEALQGAVVRNRRAGDFIYPLGAPGKKKLKDFYIDKKIPRDLRNRPIIAIGSEALWVAGIAVSQKAAVTGEKLIIRARYTP